MALYITTITWVKILILFYLLKTDLRAETEEDEEFDWELRQELSDDAYFGIKNKDVENYKLNYSILEEVNTRMSRFNETSLRRQIKYLDQMYASHYWGYLILRMCKMVTNTFRSGIRDFRRYFPIRVTYGDTLEYEVGYLTYAIVQRYQNLIELFHLIHRRYALRNTTDMASTRYIFYMYRTMLHLGQSVVHLCNMMHELEAKYRLHVNVWTVNISDSDLPSTKKPDFNKYMNAFDNLKARIKAIERWRKKKARKRRLQQQKGNIVIYTYTAEPARTNWPLIYGWSIEDWWM